MRLSSDCSMSYCRLSEECRRDRRCVNRGRHRQRDFPCDRNRVRDLPITIDELLEGAGVEELADRLDDLCGARRGGNVRDNGTLASP